MNIWYPLIGGALGVLLGILYKACPLGFYKITEVFWAIFFITCFVSPLISVWWIFIALDLPHVSHSLMGLFAGGFTVWWLIFIPLALLREVHEDDAQQEQT